jgi:glutamyl/glutaminyl-tRNA synthetase
MKGKTLSSRRPKINPKEQEILVRLRQKDTPLRDRFMEDLRFHQYSEGTAARYLEALLRLTAHYWRSPAELTDEDLRASLQKSKEVLEKISESDWTGENLQNVLMQTAEENYPLENGKVDRGALLWPLRAALTGEQKSPSPFEVAWVLGREESLNRIKDALSLI